MTLKERAAAARAAQTAAETKSHNEALAREIAEQSKGITEKLAKCFEITIAEKDLIVSEDINNGGRQGVRVSAIVEGLVFVWDNEPYQDWRGLCLVVPCTKGCGSHLPMRVDGDYGSDAMLQLDDAITGQHQHGFNCVEKPFSDPSSAPKILTPEARLNEAVRDIVRDELGNHGVGI